MKKSLFLFACLLISISCFSQARFNAGIIAGMNTTQVDGDRAEGFNKVGLNASAFVRANLNGPISITLGIGYSGKGSRRPSDPDNNDFNTWGYSFRYIDIPVVAEYRHNDLVFQAGLFGAVLLNGEQEFNENTFSIVNPEMRDYDIGAIAGIGYFINDKLFAQARFQNSLIEIRPSPDSAGQTTIYNGGMRNVVLQFSLGYQFGE